MSPSSLHSELNDAAIGNSEAEAPSEQPRMVEKALETDAVSMEHRGVVTSPSTPTAAAQPIGRSQTKSEKRSGNTLYQELSFQASLITTILQYIHAL